MNYLKQFLLSFFADIDECDAELEFPCDPSEGICDNTIGSFICSCETGYELDEDRRTCNGMLHQVSIFMGIWIIGA